MILRCYQDNLSGLEVNELLHLLMVLMNFALAKGSHFIGHLFEILSNKLKLI